MEVVRSVSFAGVGESKEEADLSSSSASFSAIGYLLTEN